MTAGNAHEFAFSKSSHFLKYPDYETAFSRAFAFSFASTETVKHMRWLFPLVDPISKLPFFESTSGLGWIM
jgi:hypothetical protein